MPSIAPWTPRWVIGAALLLAAGLFWGSRAALAADPDPAAAPLSAADIRELELARALVQAQAIEERGYGSVAKLLLSTERRFKRRREALLSALDAFRVVNARCEALEEQAALHNSPATRDALGDCTEDLRKAASRVTSFPQDEPAFLKATHIVQKRYGGCEVQKKEAEARPAKKAAYDQCLTELSGMVERIRDTYPNLEWMKQRSW